MVATGGPVSTGGTTVSVHGPHGVVDLVVPSGATSVDVAREYARLAGSATLPVLLDRLGTPLRADVPLAGLGVEPGDVLVAASTAVHRPRPAAREPLVARSAGEPGPLAALWCAVAAGLAVPAGWAAATGPATGSPVGTWPVAALLLLGAVAGVVPRGRYAPYRVLVAPAFGGAAALALAWDPHPQRLPVVVGVAALGAAVTAAVARALTEEAEEALRVWAVAGVAAFGTTGLLAVLGQPAAVAWTTVLVAAMLAARFVPTLAVDVPDQLLLDLDRLAVTAWSARDRPHGRGGRRGRTVVAPDAVAEVARRGARLVTAACAAVAAAAISASGLLLASVRLDHDVLGARCLVLLAGAALLLAARSYRHAAARTFLQLAGLGCWALLVRELVTGEPRLAAVLLPAVAIPLALVLVGVAVATGRGWRSAWWARRAEVAESLTGAAALASAVLSTGLFRVVWEFGSRAAP